MNKLIYDIEQDMVVPYLEKRNKKKRKREALVSRFENTLKPGTTTQTGIQFYKNLVYCFYNAFNVLWSEPQRNCADGAFKAALPRIIGNRWKAEEPQILKELNVPRRKNMVLIVMARRNGKSYAVAGITVSEMLTIPGITINIFSITRTQSQQMIKDIKSLYHKACQHGTFVTSSSFRVTVDNTSTFEITNTATGMSQRVTAYSGSSKVKKLLFLLFKKTPPNKTKIKWAELGAAGSRTMWNWTTSRLFGCTKSKRSSS